MAMQFSEILANARRVALKSRTATSLSEIDALASANYWYKFLLMKIFEIDGKWQEQGNRWSRDLEENTCDYYFPTDLIKLNRLSIKYDPNGEHIEATLVDPILIKQNIYSVTNPYMPSKPEYDLMSNFYRIYIPVNPIVAVSGGIIIDYQSDVADLLNSTDTTILPDAFNRFIYCGIALDYCEAFEMWNKYKSIRREMMGDNPDVKSGGLLKLVEDHYSNRVTTDIPIIEAQKKNRY